MVSAPVRYMAADLSISARTSDPEARSRGSEGSTKGYGTMTKRIAWDQPESLSNQRRARGS